MLKHAAAPAISFGPLYFFSFSRWPLPPQRIPRFLGGDIVIDGESAGSALADNSADPFESLCAPVRRLQSRFKLALIRLGRRKGPEPRLSLGQLVWQLCDLWRRETGRPVTANPVKLGDYTGRQAVGAPDGRSNWLSAQQIR